jgi:hypothetical protein
MSYKSMKGLSMSLDGLVMTVLIVAILAAAAALILENFQGEMTTDGVAYNATTDGLNAVGDITGWLGIVVIIVIAVFIIYLVRQLGGAGGA